MGRSSIIRLKGKFKNGFIQDIKFVLKPIFKILYRPTIINKEKIPTKKAFIFAGNHKNALDPALVALSTKRTVRFLAKKELLEGKTKLFFKAIKSDTSW